MLTLLNTLSSQVTTLSNVSSTQPSPLQMHGAVVLEDKLSFAMSALKMLIFGANQSADRSTMQTSIMAARM